MLDPPPAEVFPGGGVGGTGWAVGQGKGEATELGPNWEGHPGAQDGGVQWSHLDCPGLGRGPGEADLGGVVLARGWGRRPEL